MVLSCQSWRAEQTMRRMIEAAELKNQRTIAPEAHSMHLTPDTDPASTFRLRNMSGRPRLDQLQFSMSSPPGSTQVTHPCLRLPPCPVPPPARQVCYDRQLVHWVCSVCWHPDEPL